MRMVTLLPVILTGCWPYIAQPYEEYLDSDPNDTSEPGPDDVIVEGPILDIRRGVLAPGASVSVPELVVTATNALGVYAQVPGATREAGIYIFFGDAHGLQRGDVLSVDGEVGDYYGQQQIAAQIADVEVIGSADLPEPIELSAEGAALEIYEGMLVRVDGEVTDTDYDCTIDADNCVDGQLWELGGADGVVVWNNVYDGADWSAHVGEVPVAGVTTFRFERRRLLPRMDEDFQ